MKIPQVVFLLIVIMCITFSCSDSPTDSNGKNYFYEIPPPEPTIPYQLKIKVKNSIGLPMDGVGIHMLYNENNFVIRSAKIHKPNPSTTIGFSISTSGFVSVKIYRFGTKELIATLVNDSLSAGTHNIVFDASKIANGVYVYTVSTHEKSESNICFCGMLI